MTSVPLSVLDLAPVPSGGTTRQALADTVALAQRVEQLGFGRFWVAEHHGMPGVASTAPAVLIGAIAAATTTIRVGSGGVMLPNHAPLVVAEQFGTLEALHPGRIDLGIGRAPGTDPATASALRRGVSRRRLPARADRPALLLRRPRADGHPWRPCTRSRGQRPAGLAARVQRLQRSARRLPRAAVLVRAPLRAAEHPAGDGALPASFRPSEVLDEPYAMVCASVVCAETDERARELAMSGRAVVPAPARGRPGPVPTPEEALAHPYAPHELAFVEQRLAQQVLGEPATVRAGSRTSSPPPGSGAHGHDDAARPRRAAGLLRAAGRARGPVWNRSRRVGR